MLTSLAGFTFSAFLPKGHLRNNNVMTVLELFLWGAQTGGFVAHKRITAVEMICANIDGSQILANGLCLAAQNGYLCTSTDFLSPRFAGDVS